MQDLQRGGRRSRRGVAVARRFGLALALGLAAASPVLGQTPGASCAGLAATIVGSAGADTLEGGPGDDVIVGLAGDDEIDGAGGNDRLCGDAGSDLVEGSEGDDTIDGGADLDLVDGGHGNDLLAGGDGLDIVAFLDSDESIHFDFTTGKAAGDGDDTVTGFEAAAGSEQADVLIGGKEDDLFFGLGGDDTVRGGGGFDTMLFLDRVVADLGVGTASGEGLDRLSELEGLSGSRDGDVLLGDAGDNSLLGSDGADRLAGRGGDDRLSAGEGDDEVDGGAGNDTLTSDAGNDVFRGGAGDDDTLTYVESRRPVRVDLAAGLVTGEGTDNVSGLETVSGSELGDVLSGDVRANSLYGNGGTDQLVGWAGGDYLNGGAGRDRADGGAGRDHCVGNERVVRCERSSRRLLMVKPRGAGAPQLAAIARSLRRAAGARLPADFVRSVSPLATLKHLADAGSAVQYTGNSLPRCDTSRRTITIAPPEPVRLVGGLTADRVVWSAQLLRQQGASWKPVGPSTVVAEARIQVSTRRDDFNVEVWPKWKTTAGGDYPKRVTRGVKGKAVYVWRGQIEWENAYRTNRHIVDRYKQGGALTDRCRFPS